MTLALFDLDNTLLAGDSDYLWGQYLSESGIVNKEYYESENQRFYDEYKAGTLDITEFLRFSLRPLAQNDMQQLLQWRSDFIDTKIKPVLLPKADQLLQWHRDKGHTLIIITATNNFITRPIADIYRVENLIATDAELIDGRFTGEVAGIPCFQQGKVTLLQQWMQQHGASLQDSYFYSDSHNDLPLLQQVTHPVAVDADEKLLQYAYEKQWDAISLRE